MVEPVGTARTAITSSRGTSTPGVSSRRSTGWYAASRSSSGAAARSTAAVAYTASPSPSRSDSSPVAWSSSASVSRTAAIGLRRAAWLGGRPALRTPLCGTATSTADRPVVNTVDSDAAGPSRASWLPMSGVALTRYQRCRSALTASDAWVRARTGNVADGSSMGVLPLIENSQSS